MIVALIPFNSIILYFCHSEQMPTVLLANDTSTSCITFSLNQDVDRKIGYVVK